MIDRTLRPYVLAVAGLHLCGLALLLLAARPGTGLFGMAFLAYSLGLRHAFDADHIAAIDNVVRKLVRQRRDPRGVGFFFSLGHATVVFAMTLVTACAARWVQTQLPAMQRVGALVGTTVSGAFLVVVGALNLAIWLDVWRLFRALRRGEVMGEPDVMGQGGAPGGGLVARLVAPLWRFIDRSWQVYPVGVLFGLGFDTVSEVALLALSAGAATHHLPWYGVLALPVLFAAGMSLLDTADGVLMAGAYHWAAVHPLRKVYYNLTVTGLSVVAALVIGGIELAQVVAARLGLSGSFWGWVRALDLGRVGYVLVGLFLAAWGLSWTLWRVLRLDRVRGPSERGALVLATPALPQTRSAR